MPGGGGAVTVRRVSYDVEQTIHMVEHAPDFPTVAEPAKRDAYIKMLRTGIHWRAHLV